MEMGKGKSQSLVLVVSWSFGSVVGLGETFVPGVIWSQNSLSAHALAAWLAFCFVVSENNPVSDRSKNHHPGNLITPLFGYSFVQQIIIYLCGNHVTSEGNKTLSRPPRTQTNRMRDRTTVQRESLQWWLEASSSPPPQAQTFPFSRPLFFPALWQKGKLAPKSELQRVEPLYDWKEKVSEE